MPEALQLPKITGRVGRMSFNTHSMNSGVSAESTSLASKHRDPKTMLGYVVPDEGLLMQAALGIGNAVKNSSITSRIAGVSFGPEESDDDSDVNYNKQPDPKQPSIDAKEVEDADTRPHHLQSSMSSASEPVPQPERKKARLIKIQTANAESDQGVNKTNILNFYF